MNLCERHSLTHTDREAEEGNTTFEVGGGGGEVELREAWKVKGKPSASGAALPF